MTILILTPQLPYPPQQGASLRNYAILQGLARHHTITLLTFVEPNQRTDAEWLQPLQKICVGGIHFVPMPARTSAQRLRHLLTSFQPDMADRLQTPVFAGTLRHLLSTQSFKIVQIEGLELAAYLPIIRQISPQSQIVFDNHNAETALQHRAMITDLTQPRRWIAAGYSYMQMKRLHRFEQWACRQADAITCVSTSDQKALEQLAPDKPIAVIPNSLDLNQYTTPLPTNTPLPTYDLLFSGKMDYRPNVDAMLWFSREIWPKIRQALPQTTLAIVGQKPHPSLHPLHHKPDITITGWVESVKPYFAGTTLFIMPLRLGSGTRLKLIEAMAMGKPIVSTPIGAEGFPVIHQEHLLLAETPNEFATAVLTLLTQPQRRQKLSQAARQFAKQYDWQTVIPQFEAVYDQLLTQRHAPSFP